MWGEKSLSLVMSPSKLGNERQKKEELEEESFGKLCKKRGWRNSCLRERERERGGKCERSRGNEPLERRGDTWTDVVGFGLDLAIFSGILSVVLVITFMVV